MLRALDTTEPLDRYLNMKAEIRRLTDEMKELEPLILDALMDEPEETCDYLGCRMTVGRRRTYEYSEVVERRQEELKAMKKLEEANGTAEVVRHTGFVIVTQLKRGVPPFSQ